jgi:hypothetical protein
MRQSDQLSPCGQDFPARLRRTANLPANILWGDSKHGPVFGKSSLGNGPPMTMGSDNGLTFGVFDVGNGPPMTMWSDNGLTFGVFDVGNGPPMTMWSDNGLTFGDFDVKNPILSWGFWILRPRP